MANVIGYITVNNLRIYEVDADPSAGGGTAAPRGSLAVYDNGSLAVLYFKRSGTDTGWDTVDLQEGVDWTETGNALTGGSPSTPNEFLGSTNDYDVIMKRNGSEVFRLANNALLIGLNSTLGGRLQVGVSSLGDEITKQVSPNGGSGAQVVRVSRQYKVQTTDATETVLASIAIPATTRMLATCYVGGRQHAGSAGTVGDGATYIRTFDAKRESGSATLVTNQSDFTSEDLAAILFNLDVESNGNNIELRVTGQVDKNIAWSAHVEYSLFVD